MCDRFYLKSSIILFLPQESRFLETRRMAAMRGFSLLLQRAKETRSFWGMLPANYAKQIMNFNCYNIDTAALSVTRFTQPTKQRQPTHCFIVASVCTTPVC